MRNVSIHSVRLKGTREFHRRHEEAKEEKVVVDAGSARRNDLERENCNTEKHLRQVSRRLEKLVESSSVGEISSPR